MGLTTPWTRLVWAGVLVSLAATDGLMVQQEPHTDTQLYVAPATYTRREGKALPSTIIISRPLGVREGPEDDDVSTASAEDHSSEDELDLKSNIKFYKIECSSGRSCTSIIPARTTSSRPPPARAYDDIDIRKYLAQFNLRDGFPYTDDFESSGTPKEDESERHFSKHPATTSSLDRQNPRAFGSSSNHAMSNYWPGSAYRPRPLPSKGLVFKYQQYQPTRGTSSIDDFPTRRPAMQWDKIYESFPSRRPAMEWQKVPSGMEKKKKKPHRPHSPSRPSESSWPYQSSRPNQQFSGPHVPFQRDDNIVFPPYDLPRPSTTTRTTVRPPPYDGVWNRYGTSTVSQLDKDTGEWVKVSSSSTQLDQGVFERPTTSPNTLFSPSHHAVASLTVLGLNDVRRPHSTFHDSTARDTHVVEVPSALPGRPPALIETDGGHVDAMAAPEDLSPSSPRQTSLSSSSSSSTSTTSTSPPDPHTSVAPSELSQVSVPFLLISTKSLTEDQSSTSTPLPTTTTTTTTNSPTTTTTTTNSPTTTTTSTSPSTTTRPRPQPLVTRAATTRAATTTTSTTTTTTTTTTTQAPQPAEEGSFLDNPYAVMAAVGAGLIPATFAALLPAFIGRRRRRRSAVAASDSDAFPDGGGGAARPSEVEELSARVRRAVRSLEGGQT